MPKRWCLQLTSIFCLPAGQADSDAGSDSQVFPLHATFLELASDEDTPSQTPCDRQLAGQLAQLPAEIGEPATLHPEYNEDKSYQIDFVLNPKAWGNSASNKPITIWIDKKPESLLWALTREVHSAFVLGSWHQVDQFAVGVFGLQRYGSLHEFGPGGELQGGLSGDKLEKFLDARVALERRPLWDAYTAARQALRHKAQVYEEQIESYAQCRALREELFACDRATLDEARRYLSLSDQSDARVRAALKPTSSLTHALTGPDGRALMTAVRALAPPLQQLRAAQENHKNTLPESTKEMLMGNLWMTMLGPLSLPLQIQRHARQFKTAMTPPNERAAAAAALAEKSAAFQEIYTTYAAAFPILNKVGEHVDEAAGKLGEGPFTRRVVDALQDALEASAELSKVLAQDPVKVWRFPGLINRSLERGFRTDLPFAQRVAANRLLKENATPFFARLNGGIQLLDGTLTLVPSPHVKIAMLLATVIGDTSELVESYFHTAEQRLGFRAAIDPSRALGPDASYASTLLQTAFLGLGLLPVKGMAKEFVEESAKATQARKVRQIALQGAL